MHLYFITGNSFKFQEAKEIIPELRHVDIDLPEIQELSPKKIIKAKLLAAREKIEAAIVVEDVSLYFECLGNLPGPLIKWFLQTLGNKGLYELCFKYQNFKSRVLLTIGLINEERKIEFFENSLEGTIVYPRGTKGFGWDQIFLPAGYEKTLAELDILEKNKISMRAEAFRELKLFL